MIMLAVYVPGLLGGLAYAFATSAPAYAPHIQNGLLLASGLLLLGGGSSHIFRTEAMARQLGWEPGGAFQKAQGVWNIAGGVICVASPWCGAGFRAAASTASAIFWIGVAILHMTEPKIAGADMRDGRIAAASETLLGASLIALALSSA